MALAPPGDRTLDHALDASSILFSLKQAGPIGPFVLIGHADLALLEPAMAASGGHVAGELALDAG